METLSLNETVANLSPADLNLITTLWLQDLTEIASSCKHKGREDLPPDDNTLALDLLARDLENAQMTSRDRQFAQSVALALESDREILEEVMQEEETARRDRDAAIELDRRDNISRPASAMSMRSNRSNGPLVDGSVYSYRSATPLTSRAESSQQALKQSRLVPPQPTVSCVICTENVTTFVRVPCNDTYCLTCICELFEHAIKDESLMPPRCCRTQIPFSSISSYLPNHLQTKFLAKLEEHNTLNRLYCPNPTCSAFLGSADGERRTVICTEPTCRTRICTSCKKGAHSFLVPCEEDKEIEEAVGFCREQGWQRCPGCRRMVELTHGCYHMTCLCRAQFCYVCSATWKTCNCPQWDEQRLYNAARGRVQDEHRAREVPQALIENMVEQLRENHDCTHARWYTVWGPSQCESCNHYLQRFILRCHECGMRACVRCRRNRL